MARKTGRVGQGFSLFDLKDDIAQVVEILGGALSRQGVTVDQDNLFLQLQTVVKSVGDGFGSPYSGGPGYPSIHASDMVNSSAPYSVAGDLLAIAYSHFSNGDKPQAVKTVMTAMRSDDFSEIVAGLIAMNSRSDIQKLAAEAETTETDVNEDDVEDSDEDDSDLEDDTDSDVDLSDEELEALLEDGDSEDGDTELEDTSDSDDTDESTVEADDEKSLTETSPTVKKPDAKAEVVKDEEDEEEDDSDGSLPMGGTSSTVTASHTAKVLANRLSLDGSRESLSKAKVFMQKHHSVGK